MRRTLKLVTIGIAATLASAVPPGAPAGAATASRPAHASTAASSAAGGTAARPGGADRRVTGPALAGSATRHVAAADEGELWVTNQGASRLSILEGDRVIETVELPPDTGPHITTFSPDGRYAYVGGMGNGDLLVLRADDRQVVAALNFGRPGTHQARPSPDGSLLLVAQVASRSLIKVAADQAAESWSAVGAVSLAPLGKAPVCTVFRDDGQRAYVSLLPSGLAIVDVPSMTLVDVLPTDGFLACGMVKSQDGTTVTLAGGGGGHVYRLDTATDALSDAGVLGAADWHSFNVSPDERTGFGTSPGSDELLVIDLTGATASTIATLALDPTPGPGNDQPDAIGVRGDTIYVSLRASGKLAIVDANHRTATYLDISPPAPFDPATCAGCAVHGVTVRPLPSGGADRRRHAAHQEA